MVLQSIVSDKIIAPVVGAKDITSAGINKKEFISAMNTTKSQFQFAIDFAKGESFLHKLPATINSVKAFIKSPMSIFNSTGPTTLRGVATSIAEGAETAYAILGLIVAVTDIATADMDDTNNADLKRWRIFSDGFNTYATPGGWSFLLADAIHKAMDVPNVQEDAVKVKRIWLAMYNPSYRVYDPSYSTLRFCTFKRNYASVGNGGAMATEFDNVHIEGCRFEENQSFNSGGAGAYTFAGGGLGAGGAIFNNGGILTIRNSSFSNNVVAGGGPAFFADYDGEDYGAAVFTRNGEVEIADSKFLWSVPTANAIYVLGDGGTGTLSTLRSQVVLANTFDNYDIQASTINGGKAKTYRDNTMDDTVSQSKPYIIYLYDYTLFNHTNVSLISQFFVSEPMGDVTNYSFSATSDNPYLINDTNLVLSRSVSVITLNMQPETEVYDQALITVTLTDGDVSFSESFQLDIGLFFNMVLNSNNRMFTFAAQNNKTYNIQRATSLQPPDWTNVGAASRISYGKFNFVDTNALPDKVYFYRLQVQ